MSRTKKSKGRRDRPLAGPVLAGQLAFLSGGRYLLNVDGLLASFTGR